MKNEKGKLKNRRNLKTEEGSRFISTMVLNTILTGKCKV